MIHLRASALLKAALAAAAGVAFIAAVSPAPVKAADRDQANNIYPPECPPEIVGAIDVPVRVVGRRDLDLACQVERALGCYTAFEAEPAIYILEGLPAWKEADVRRHESCHRIWVKLKGHPFWHPLPRLGRR